MNNNKQGFTLIEIIISIALMSIVLMIVGSIIVSTTGFLSKSTQSDLDKRSVDSTIDFVKSEIQYSSDVRITTQAPISTNKKDDWHSIYVKDNTLYRDGKKVYTDDFYSNKKLSLSAKCNYESNQRLDISYKLSDDTETAYSSRDTIVLFNLIVSDEIKNQGLYTQEAKDLTVNADGTGYRIYYNKYLSVSAGSNTPASKLTGTVADIQENIFWGNSRGVYTSGYLYNFGEIVWHNGFWWECISDEIKNVPGESYMWKCLDMNYTNSITGINKLKSSYEKNDIVIYDGSYYKMKSQTIIQDDWAASIGNTNTWEYVGKVGNSSDESTVKKNKYIRRTVYNNETVVKKYFPANISMKDPSRSGIPEYSKSNIYKVGDIVKIKNFFDKSEKYYDIYIKKFDVSSILEDSINEFPSSGWIKIDVSYDGKSSYAKDDIVIAIKDTYSIWVKAKKNILDNNNPFNEDWNSNDYWSKL